MSWRDRRQGISVRGAVSAVNIEGILLVYPINNRKEPPSLWSHFFPKSKMRWVWDENGDDRVVQMWDLRERMSRGDGVVYSKWYQGRATFFSRDIFTALLSLLHGGDPSFVKLSEEGEMLYETLLDNSPQTTKVLKKRMKQQCGWANNQFDRSMKELWLRCLIVGCGEVDDGAFPSLNVGATQLMREDLWKKAHAKNPTRKWGELFEKVLPDGSLWRKNFERVHKKPQLKRKAVSGTLTYSDIVSRKR